MPVHVTVMLAPMTRELHIGTALAVAALLGWLAWDGWPYLQSGYSLGISIAGRSGSVYHIDFPVWRAVVHLLLWVVAMVAIIAYLSSLRWASIAAWLTFAATSMIGIYDVVQYGTMGSPTSIWAVLLLLLFALLATFRPLSHKPNF